MATVSSHILDGVDGTHAGGIRVQLFGLTNGQRESLLFDIAADDGGRVAQEVNVDTRQSDAIFELVFHSSAYFADKANQTGNKVEQRQILSEVVVRIEMPDADARYHLPLMLSPHSYSIWWSQ